MSATFDGRDKAPGELPPTLADGSGAPPPDEGDLVGRVLGGRYKILRRLGEGAMGAVYLGEHLKIGRLDAIKVLHDPLANDPATIARFVRGTRNVSMIRHPNICTIYDYSDTDDGTQFVAMELVEGETLRDMLEREGRLPVDLAVRIAAHVADALQAAHGVGIVHRDLKPGNIMLSRGRSGDLEIKVVDFDIAKGSSEGEGEEVTRMGFVIGTPEYMSPEQLIGERLDGRSDLYSLALVLYRMLTGTLPFVAEDMQDVMVKRLTEEPLTLRQGFPEGEFPPAMEAVIARGLRRKPAERQASAADFRREIERAVAGGMGAEAAEEDATVAGRPVGSAGAGGGRGLWWGMIGSGVVVAIVAAVVVGLGGGGGDELPTTATFDQPESLIQTGPTAAGEPTPLADASPPQISVPVPVTTPSPTPSNTEDPGSGVAESESPASTLPSQDELFDILADLPGPSETASLQAARDAGAMVWDHFDADPVHRAMGAYLASNALATLGDTAQAVTWIRRALDLRPGYEPYLLLLRAFESAPPP